MKGGDKVDRSVENGDGDEKLFGDDFQGLNPRERDARAESETKKIVGLLSKGKDLKESALLAIEPKPIVVSSVRGKKMKSSSSGRR